MKSCFVFLLFYYFSGSVFSQQLTQSIYSRYGLGIAHEQYTTSTTAMGGLHTAINDTNSFVVGNPASIAAIKTVLLDANFNLESNQFETPSYKKKYKTGYIGNLGLAFPVTDRWKAGLFLQPYTSVGYFTRDTFVDASVGKVVNYHEGRGGSNKVGMSHAFQLHKYLNVGVNAAYIFGNITHSTATYLNPPTSSDIYSEKIGSIQGFQGGIGFQSTFLLGARNSSDTTRSIANTLRGKKGWQMNIGAYYTFATRLNMTYSAFNSKRTFVSAAYLVDTIYYKAQENLKNTLPSTWSVGFWLQRLDKRWGIGAEIKNSNWKNYTSPFYTSLGTGLTATNKSSTSVGIQYLPNEKGLKYRQRIRYKLGMYSHLLGLAYNSSAIKDEGFTAGFSLPFARPRATIKTVLPINFLHVSISLGQLNTKGLPTTNQTYGRIQLGFSFSDDWFIRRKYD